jgi:hypothetical protein
MTTYCTRSERQNQSKISYVEHNVSELAEELRHGHFALIAPPPQSEFTTQTRPITIVRGGTKVAHLLQYHTSNTGYLKGLARTLCKEYQIPEFFLYENGILHKYPVNEKHSVQTYEWDIRNILDYLNLPSGEVEFFRGPYNQYNRSVHVWSF